MRSGIAGISALGARASGPRGRIRSPRATVAAAAALALFCHPASAQWQALEALQGLAEAHVLALLPADGIERTVTAQTLDPRLRLAGCADAPEAFLSDPRGAVRSVTTVGLRCRGPAPWTVYVRVGVEAVGTVVVARRTLARGERVSAADLRLERRRLDQLAYGWFESTAAVVGRPVLRPVPANAALTPAVLGHQHQVEKGQRVELRASTGGISVGMPGEALTDGAQGERIRVRNLSSNRVVEGIVRSPKVVEVLLD